MQLGVVLGRLILAVTMVASPSFASAQKYGISGFGTQGPTSGLTFGIHPDQSRIRLKSTPKPAVTRSKPSSVVTFVGLTSDKRTARLKHLIGFAESRRDGYDAIHYGAQRKPAKRPTELTLREVIAWINATPGQNHAIGRYQFIPTTLINLIERAKLGPETVFSPGTQDHLAQILLEDAGYSAFLKGQLSQTKFMNNLAGIWAGLPTSSGKSRYHGYAGNRATITWVAFKTEIGRIFGR
tara:strand:- start:5071 stop:5787 length:717 start_codon:yes stop_codon:yes gene_type:complete